MRIVIYLIGVFALAACSFRQPCVEELAGIEPYVESRPDSARTLLSKIDVGRLRSEGCWAYYNLLKTSAEDKDRVQHRSDSVMLRVVAYYQGRDPEKLQWAYYLLGRVYRDLGDSQEAAKAFRKALEADPKGQRHDLLGRIYEQLFYLYSYQNAFPEALEMVNNSYQNYKIHNDSIGVAYALRNRARLYEKMGSLDSMAIYYRNAAQMAFSAGDSTMGYSSWRELAAMHVRYQRFDDSERILAQLPEANKQNNGITLKNIADIYRYRQQPDSACHYYQQALKAEYDNNIYLQKKIYQALADLDSVRDGHSAFRYERMASCCADSIRKLEQTETIRDLDYRQTKIEKQELELENARGWLLICGLIIGGGFLVELLCFGWKYIQRLQVTIARIWLLRNYDHRTLAKIQAQLADVRQQLTRSEQMYEELEQASKGKIAEWEEKARKFQESIREKEEQIAQLRQLEKTVLDKEAQIEELLQSLEHDQQALAKSQEEIKKLQDFAAQAKESHQKVTQALQQKEKELETFSWLLQQNADEKKPQLDTLRGSEIAKFFAEPKNQNRDTLKTKWDELQKAIEEASPRFTGRLIEKYPDIAPVELHLCYLVKIGLKPKAIRNILGYSPQNITSLRARLYEKLCGVKGGAKDLDALIANL